MLIWHWSIPVLENQSEMSKIIKNPPQILKNLQFLTFSLKHSHMLHLYCCMNCMMNIQYWQYWQLLLMLLLLLVSTLRIRAGLTQYLFFVGAAIWSDIQLIAVNKKDLKKLVD